MATTVKMKTLKKEAIKFRIQPSHEISIYIKKNKNVTDIFITFV